MGNQKMMATKKIIMGIILLPITKIIQMKTIQVMIIQSKASQRKVLLLILIQIKAMIIKKMEVQKIMKIKRIRRISRKIRVM